MSNLDVVEQPLVEMLRAKYGNFMRTQEIAERFRVSAAYVRSLPEDELPAMIRRRGSGGNRYAVEAVAHFIVRRNRGSHQAPQLGIELRERASAKPVEAEAFKRAWGAFASLKGEAPFDPACLAAASFQGATDLDTAQDILVRLAAFQHTMDELVCSGAHDLIVPNGRVAEFDRVLLEAAAVAPLAGGNKSSPRFDPQVLTGVARGLKAASQTLA